MARSVFIPLVSLGVFMVLPCLVKPQYKYAVYFPSRPSIILLCKGKFHSGIALRFEFLLGHR